MAVIVCPKCKKQFQGPTGARVKCPNCGTQLETPPSAEQIKQKKQETQKQQRVVSGVFLSLFLVIVAYFIWDAATFTKDEYEREYAEIWEEIDHCREEQDDVGYKKSSAEFDLKYAETQNERDRATISIEIYDRMYAIQQDTIEMYYRQLDDLQEKYESGIWYRLFG